jgi:hypothetical protein
MLLSVFRSFSRCLRMTDYQVVIYPSKRRRARGPPRVLERVPFGDVSITAVEDLLALVRPPLALSESSAGCSGVYRGAQSRVGPLPYSRPSIVGQLCVGDPAVQERTRHRTYSITYYPKKSILYTLDPGSTKRRRSRI